MRTQKKSIKKGDFQACIVHTEINGANKKIDKKKFTLPNHSKLFAAIKKSERWIKDLKIACDAHLYNVWCFWSTYKKLKFWQRTLTHLRKTYKAHQKHSYSSWFFFPALLINEWNRLTGFNITFVSFFCRRKPNEYAKYRRKKHKKLPTTQLSVCLCGNMFYNALLFAYTMH